MLLFTALWYPDYIEGNGYEDDFTPGLSWKNIAKLKILSTQL